MSKNGSVYPILSLFWELCSLPKSDIDAKIVIVKIDMRVWNSLLYKKFKKAGRRASYLPLQPEGVR